MHHSWTLSWLARLANGWLKSLQSGQCVAFELESLHSARSTNLDWSKCSPNTRWALWWLNIRLLCTAPILKRELLRKVQCVIRRIRAFCADLISPPKYAARLSPVKLPGGVMVTRPPSRPPTRPPLCEPACRPQVATALIKMSFLIIIDCPVHFGKQLQRWALAVAVTPAKYRHVTLVFSPVRWSRSDMRARKVGQQPSLPSGRWTTAHTHIHTHTHIRPQMASAPFQGSSATGRKNTHKKNKTCSH